MKLCDLTLSRTISASPEAIFDVWLDPKSPGGPWFDAVRVIFQPDVPSVDGLFYHSVAYEGHSWAHHGRFVELDRPRVVSYTWLSAATQGVESLVTVRLEPSGDPSDGRTVVTLVHKNLPDDELGRQHEDGWDWILSALADRFDAPAT
ncbi:MAG TPA: SRPBCC domain-containing protein [Kofleriaceae bacterium]|jgi:uncharacterized protein YndB with AHSA1/START domain|nr:SRPBCC domain-containing protein [Kofleriaceae bacterium]